jgi:transcriptional regulator with XRE-family HTH domain
MTYVMMCDVKGQTFGQRIRDRREELEWSQETAAEKAGIGVDTWRTIERGYKARSGADPATSAHRPVRITVRKIAKALGWTAEQALAWAGYDEPCAELVAEPQPRQDPRVALLHLIPGLPQRHAQLLFDLAQTMSQQVGGTHSEGGRNETNDYSERDIEGPSEVPDQRNNDNGDDRSLSS